MTLDDLRTALYAVLPEYPIRRVTLFGSRADGTNREDSDVDLIMEFSAPVSLVTLSALKSRLEELLRLDVDIIHGPIRPTDLIEYHGGIELYAA